jgi:hypothetical protein
MHSIIPLNYDRGPKIGPSPPPPLVLPAKVVEFGSFTSAWLGWVGSQFFKIFLPGPGLKLWKSGDMEWSGLSEKRTLTSAIIKIADPTKESLGVC